MSINWKTWSPFQSKEVREICAHMTDAEHTKLSRRAYLYGAWVFATVARPSSSALGNRNPAVIGIAVVLLVVHVVCIPIWQRMQRNFLCSTAWAREHGYTPKQLRLFSFRD